MTGKRTRVYLRDLEAKKTNVKNPALVRQFRQEVDQVKFPPWQSLQGHLELEDGFIKPTVANFYKLYPASMGPDPTGLAQYYAGPEVLSKDDWAENYPLASMYLRSKEQVDPDYVAPAYPRPRAFDFEWHPVDGPSTTDEMIEKGPSLSMVVMSRVLCPVERLPIFQFILDHSPPPQGEEDHRVWAVKTLEPWIDIAVQALGAHVGPVSRDTMIVFNNEFCHLKTTSSWAARGRLEEYYEEWKAAKELSPDTTHSVGRDMTEVMANRPLSLVAPQARTQRYLVTVNTNVAMDKYEEWLSAVLPQMTGPERMSAFEGLVSRAVQTSTDGKYHFRGALEGISSSDLVKSVALIAKTTEMSPEKETAHVHVAIVMSYWSVGETYVHLDYEVLRSQIRQAAQDWGFSGADTARFYINVSREDVREGMMKRYVRKDQETQEEEQQ